MEIKIDIDQRDIEQKIKDKATQLFSNVAHDALVRHFSNKRYISDGKVHDDKGDGLKEIEEMVENRFLDAEFRQRVDRFFEDNWVRIFEDCMTKAIQHRCNAIAFAKVKEKKSQD